MPSVLTDHHQQIDDLIRQHPDVSWMRNELLAPKTYFKIGGPADVYAEIGERQMLLKVVSYCQSHQIPLTFLGGGSNVIISDQGIRGVVLRWVGDSVQKIEDEQGTPVLYAEAGVKTALLVSQSVSQGFAGLEYFLGVPGTLGGAIYNNAHYMQDLIGEHVLAVEVIGKDSRLEWISQQACDFAYEKSRFQKTGELIVSVKFSLSPGNESESKAKIAEATRYRALTQPLGIPSSGCIFQNVPNTPQLSKRFPDFADKEFVPGGYIIDQAGLKGLREGDIEVSEKHAAWLINRGSGSAKQVKRIIQKIKETVSKKYGVTLKEEVFFLK